jgi:hypothetical protein
MCKSENSFVDNKEKNRRSAREKMTEVGSFRKRPNSLELTTGANWPSIDTVIISWMK